MTGTEPNKCCVRIITLCALGMALLCGVSLYDHLIQILNLKGMNTKTTLSHWELISNDYFNILDRLTIDRPY